MNDTSRSGGIRAAHQAQLDQGRFLIQHCSQCQRHIYFPRESCPHCGSEQVQLVAPSGLGTVHAVTTVRRKPEAGGDTNVSLVDLDEGVRLMSRIANLPVDAVRIGQRVQARVQIDGGAGLVVFDVVQDRTEHTP
ncbi:Zn-ribbon domain-containing OB-fold protein [Lacisediminimonas sp.]|uniref:Zn-ribbon domain-containing OB-fold protein n=1 Tax=Lacisediminimonas sp. TaxID=3060582 RepID=UPI002722CE81|nr:OB-fold domain-containing protein [Lacisediminimonas sp.]MDO8300805.1 OB-fold domain-containing protein [Lacisediminimonas sp.]